jgi:hypothetical protein
VAGNPMSRRPDSPQSLKDEIAPAPRRERARDIYAAEWDAARRLHGNKRSFAPLILSLVVVSMAGLVWVPQQVRGLFQRGVAQVARPLEQAFALPQPTADAAAEPRIPSLGVPLSLAEMEPQDATSSARPTATVEGIPLHLTVLHPTAPQQPSPSVAAAPSAAASPVPDTQPASGKAAPAPVRKEVSPDEVRRLMARASELIALADISGARLLLKRAASSGDTRAVFALAETYDPEKLSAWGVRGITGDRERASALHAEARANGFSEGPSQMIGLR